MEEHKPGLTCSSRRQTGRSCQEDRCERGRSCGGLGCRHTTTNTQDRWGCL